MFLTCTGHFDDEWQIVYINQINLIPTVCELIILIEILSATGF